MQKGNSGEALRNAEYNSERKKMIYVTMPFDPIFDDSFHYGIQGAVNASGYLCERAVSLRPSTLKSSCKTI